MLFGDAPQGRPPTWHPPPENRGSFTILSTCIITLMLCIWTAIHLNIPEHHNRQLERSKWDPRGWITNQQWRKVNWVIIGLFAPEMIAFTAWAQRREALIFHKRIQEILDRQGRSSVDPPRSSSATAPASIQYVELSPGGHREQSSFEPISQTFDQDIELGINQIHPNSSPEQPGQELSGTLSASGSQITADPANSAIENPSRRHQWTITHSFFVASGGFAFDMSSLPEDQKFLPGLRDRVTLNPGAVLCLAENFCSLVPDISEAVIKDKSKANALAKSIVCFQAVWFIIQCIFRLAQGLPISLLELNTFAHSICALLIYCLWWNKPLDIEEPTIIDDKSIDGICALLCSNSLFDGTRDMMRVDLGIYVTVYDSRPHSLECFYDTTTESLSDTTTESLSDIPPESLPNVPPESLPDVPPESLPDVPPESLPDVPPESLPDVPSGATRLVEGEYLPSTTIRVRNIGGKRKPESDWYYPRDLRRWKLAYSARNSYRITGYKGISEPELRDRLRNGPKISTLESFLNFLLLDNLNSSLIPQDRDGIVVLLAFTFAGLTYGALHLLAWKSPFTSHTQEMLWQISALAIGSSGPALVLLAFLLRPISLITEITKESYSVPKVWRYPATGFVILMFLSYLLFYIFARFYLVVECFISLAYLPDSVFQQPRWTYYFPHIA